VSDNAPDSDSESSTFASGIATPNPAARREGQVIGTRLGQFRVEARIGEGGRGVVYRAYDEKLHRAVALKVLADASTASGVGLLEEARAAAALMHPAIAAIHDVLQHDGVVFLVMELVAGATLRAELQRGRMPLQKSLKHARDIASGLARAHRSGIVHRDLKPENLMVTPDGETKILDFGLARAAPEAPPATGDGELTGVAGTPGYMAPEQATGRRVDARADVFSFGVVLWEMLAGRRPFERPTRAELTEESAFTPTFSLPSLAPDTPPSLVALVMRCLELRPDDRFADASELLDALDTVELHAHTAARAQAVLLRPVPVTALALLGTVAALLAVRSLGGPPGQSSRKASAPVPTDPSAASLAITGAPEALTHEGLCSSFPAFADDGTLVYARHDGHETQIHHLDPSTGEDTTLTHDPNGQSLRPAIGPNGTVLYTFQANGEEHGRQVRQVSLHGGPPEVLGDGTEPVYAGGTIFLTEQDDRAIRRLALGGTSDIVYESPPGSLYGCLAASPDGKWLAACSTSVEDRVSFPLCITPLGAERPPFDCASVGNSTSLRITFGPSGRGLYFARGKSIVRFDVATRHVDDAPVPVAPTSLAIAPDAGSVVFSTCRVHYDARRIDGDGSIAPLPAMSESAGVIVVGPHGELAFPVAIGTGTAVGVTDARGEHVHVITSPDHDVTEAAFSPDGQRLVFHDARESGGGLFVINVDGKATPVRITKDPQDNVPGWIDGDRIVFMRPESGVPFGRAHVVSAAGGEATSLPKVPGIVLGGIPSRGTILLAIRSPAGDRFAEATQGGKVRDIPLKGAPKGQRWDVATGVSPSGRYAAWFSGGAVWRADLEDKTATKVPFEWPNGVADGISADDEGRVSASFRHSEGQLFRATGSFP
jgi:serine/threonine protein kinase